MSVALHQLPMCRRFEALPRDGIDPAASVRIGPGTLADYSRLAVFHYRGACPATVEAVLAARAAGEVVGVLVVSRPTLNARWRERAWPRRYASGDRRADAARLNAEVRTISRVIVEPRWRGLGIASRLVGAYLAAPLTARTEAVAAMGAVCPFFRAAGMREVRVGITARERRLRVVMRRAGLRMVDLLGARAGWVESALRIWADASRATRRSKKAPVEDLGRMAAAAMCGTVAYVHG